MFEARGRISPTNLIRFKTQLNDNHFRVKTLVWKLTRTIFSRAPRNLFPITVAFYENQLKKKKLSSGFKKYIVRYIQYHMSHLFKLFFICTLA